MERANPIVLILGLLAMLLFWGGAGWLMDAIYLAKHEGDAVHLLDILLRMAAGQTPHRDFLTPIGSMAFRPIVWFMGPETGAGRAFILSQIAVLVALLPAVFWVGLSRLTTLQALAFGVIVTVIVVAFVHGEAQPTLSVSMHYNRWSWALSYIAIALAILPVRGVRLPLLDGLIIGVAFALLLLTKVTYVAGFAVPVLIALVARREWAALFAAIVSGALVVAGYSAVVGIDYWSAYVRDILVVTNSDVRPSPGRDFGAVVGSPAFLGASLIVLVSVIFLRQAREMLGGLILLLLVPGFFYVTYQNFGNDPQWLYLLPILLFAMRPVIEIRNSFGWDMRRATTTAAVIAMALAAPSFFNLAYSPFRHLTAKVEEYTPLIRGEGVNSDVLTTIARAYDARRSWELLDPGLPFASYASEFEERDAQIELLGEALPRCEMASGVVAYFDAVAKDLEAAGYAGSTVMAADLFSTIHWVYGDFPPLKGGAPWSYATDAGIEAAQYLLVPICPLHGKTRRQMLEVISERADVSLTEVYRSELYILLRVSRG